MIAMSLVFAMTLALVDPAAHYLRTREISLLPISS